MLLYVMMGIGVPLKNNKLISKQFCNSLYEVYFEKSNIYIYIEKFMNYYFFVKE